MTAKRQLKKQLKRDALLADTLLAKPIDKCTLEECLRLRAFYTAALKHLGINPVDMATKLSARKKPSARATSETSRERHEGEGQKVRRGAATDVYQTQRN